MDTPDTTHEPDGTELQTPLIVSLAAGGLAVTSAFMLMIALQIGLSMRSFDALSLTMRALLLAYILVGAGGGVSALLLARGKALGAIAGLVCALLCLGLFWTPWFMGMLAASMLLCGAFAFVTLPLVALSVPSAIALEKRRRAFFDTI